MSAYVRAVVERDLAGETPDATSPQIIVELARKLRGDLTGLLATTFSRNDADQPAVLAALLEALAELLRRKPEVHLDSFVLVDGSAASELQLLMASAQSSDPIREKITNAVGAPSPTLLRLVAAAAEHAARYADTVMQPTEDQVLDSERNRDAARIPPPQGKGSRRSSSQ